MSFPGVFSLKDLAEQFISYDETFLELVTIPSLKNASWSQLSGWTGINAHWSCCRYKNWAVLFAVIEQNH